VSVTINRRTKIDWSKHEVTTSQEGNALIHIIKQPNTCVRAVYFYNIGGILAVTGDFGNWIFCREFHPSKDGFVSDHYWCEKARISSSQETHKFCSDSTRKEIESLIANACEDEPITEEELEYLNDLLDYVDDSYERYMVYAYDNQVGRFDFENIPCVKKINPWLDCIFDAFDEICRRMNP